MKTPAKAPTAASTGRTGMSRPSARLPLFYSKRQIADHVGLSEKTIERLIKRGDLRAHRFGNRVRIAEEDAISFIASRRR